VLKVAMQYTFCNGRNVYYDYKCSMLINIKSALQNNSQLQALKARDEIHGFVCISMVIKSTCIKYSNTTITSDYLNGKN